MPGMQVDTAERVDEAIQSPAASVQRLDEEQQRTAEYRGSGVDVLSREPLTGSCKLMMNDDDIGELMLDRESPEDRLSALIQFLAAGEGEDAPGNITKHNQH